MAKKGNMPDLSIAEKVLTILAEVGETAELTQNPDLRLYDLDILDSMKTVELMVALSEQFGIEISPAEFEREQWATPRHIAAYIESRVAAQTAVSS
jgi:D-alanine--poly(phosphoribitol) ligase subunit 2